MKVYVIVCYTYLVIAENRDSGVEQKRWALRRDLQEVARKCLEGVQSKKSRTELFKGTDLQVVEGGGAGRANVTGGHVVGCET